VNRLRRNWATLTVLAVLIVVAVLQAQNPASYVSEGVARITEGPGPGASVHRLTSVDALKARFNADQGHPRLLLLFSPT
jgi:hypothetical protein